jgi:hypothetical protein
MVYGADSILISSYFIFEQKGFNVCKVKLLRKIFGTGEMK